MQSTQKNNTLSCQPGGEASPTFGHANAIFSVFINRKRNLFLKKLMNNDNDLNLHSMTKLSGWLRYCASPNKRNFQDFQGSYEFSRTLPGIFGAMGTPFKCTVYKINFVFLL